MLRLLPRPDFVVVFLILFTTGERTLASNQSDTATHSHKPLVYNLTNPRANTFNDSLCACLGRSEADTGTEVTLAFGVLGIVLAIIGVVTAAFNVRIALSQLQGTLHSS